MLERLTVIRCLRQSMSLPGSWKVTRTRRPRELRCWVGGRDDHTYTRSQAHMHAHTLTHTYKSREGRRHQHGSSLGSSSADEQFGEQRGRTDLKLIPLGVWFLPTLCLCKHHIAGSWGGVRCTFPWGITDW